MTGFSVEEIRIYAQKNPQTCQGKTDEEIVSIMMSDKNLQLSKEQEFSLFFKPNNNQLYFNAYDFSGVFKENSYFISPDKPQLELDQQEEQAYNFLNRIFEKADTNFENQLKTEGKVSYFVNYVREKTNAENTRTDVDNALKDTKSDLKFLEASLHGQLVNGNGEIVEFQDAFKTLRGVKFSQDKINTCQQKSQIYMQADMINSGFNELINNLEEFSKASTNLNNPKEFNKNMLKSFSNLGIKDYDDINNILEKFNEKNGSEYKLIELGTNDKEYYKQNFAIMHKNKDGRYLPLTPEQAQSLSEAMQTKLQDVKNIMLGLPPSATQEDCDNYVLQLKNDYKSAFKDAYGTKELTILSEEYINAQQKGVGYINMGVTVGAIALAVFTGGATATIATAVAMAQPMQILENATDSNGFTQQDWNEYEKMVAQQLPWMAVGMGMGKIGDMARSCVKLKGLQSVAQKTGQSLDDYINTVAKAGNLPDDVAKTLKSTRVLAETAGVSTEFALDIATTLAVYRDIKSEDWLMALAGALAGSKMNAKLAQMGTPNAKAQFLMDTFKELKLTPDEANKILKAMDKIVDETADNVNKPSREQLKEQIASGKKINNESNSTPDFLTEIRSNAENLAEGDIIFADIKGYGKVEITKLADDKFTYKLVKKYSENQSEIVQPEKVYNANNKKEFINAINEILPDENLTKMLEGLSEQDNKILKNVFENIYKPYENHEYGYNDFIEFVNLLQTRCQEQNTKISDELQFIDKILKSPRDTDNLIDCPGAILIPQGNVEWNIAKRLFELKETCDNPVLNVDNIVYLSSSMKDISDIELLVKRFEEKNPDGTYKYGIDDFDNKYDIDKSLINAMKQSCIERYAEYPAIQKEIEDLFDKGTFDDIQTFQIYAEIHKDPDKIFEYLNARNPKTILSDIEENIGLVTDDVIKNRIIAQIKVIENLGLTRGEEAQKLREQRQLLDAYNNLKGNYVTLDNKYWGEYFNFLAKYDPELQKTISGEDFDIEVPEHIKSIENNSSVQKFKSFLRYQYLVLKEAMGIASTKDVEEMALINSYKNNPQISDIFIKEKKEFLNEMLNEFKESQRVEQFVDYCKKHNDEVSQYMYEEVYLKDCDFAPEIKQRLVDINRQYGVKIFPNKNLGNDAERCLKYIERELTAWKIASNGTAKYPPVIDFTISKRDYIDDKSAFGQSVTAGFSESHANGAISMDGMTYKQVKHAFRHELMHSNDLKRLSHFEEGFVVKEDGKIVAQKCKFYDDFVKLGISEYHIPYAYNNPKEFIAVAAESTKLNECSPEFKQTLIDFGMPEWMFDVKYDEDAWMLDFDIDFKIKNDEQNINSENPSINTTSREELKSTIMKGEKINGAQKEINIPKGGLEAPRAGFGETTTDYVNIIKNNELEIIDMVYRYADEKITFEELAYEYISLLQKGMDLQVIPDVRSYTTNSRFAGAFNPLNVRVSYSLDGLSGNVSDLFATITHEFHHLMQTKEMILTDFDKFIETMAEANNITDIDGLKNVAVENWLDILVHYSENTDPNSPYTQRGQALLSANETYTTNDMRQYIQNLKEVETHEVQINIAIEMKHLLNEMDDNTYQVTKDVYKILQHYCDEDVALLKAKEYFETGSINDFVNYCQRASNDGLNPNEIVIKMMDDFTPQEPAKKQNFFSRLFKHS